MFVAFTDFNKLKYIYSFSEKKNSVLNSNKFLPPISQNGLRWSGQKLLSFYKKPTIETSCTRIQMKHKSESLMDKIYHVSNNYHTY